MKYKNVILIPPNLAYGDCLSVIGLLYYLLNYYENVYFFLGTNHSLIEYYNEYFSNDQRFKKQIHLLTDGESLINNNPYGEFHICNTMTGDWSKANTLFMDLVNINKDFYFNDLNPIYNQLNIPEEHILKPNKHLPCDTVEVNHIFYYNLIGLNNSVRMDYFHYERNIDLENEIKNNILKRFGIFPGEKYNIINDPVNVSRQVMEKINNPYKTININFLESNPGKLTKLLEDAESIHFVEGCNVNFFYHCQYKNIFNYNKKIHFHIWARNRHWLYPKMNLDYAWKMMDYPKISGWEFLF